MNGFPIFNGMSRAPTYGGVPLAPLTVMLMIVAAVAMNYSMWAWLLVAIFWPTMALICKHDDKAFRIIGLWAVTKLRNRVSVKQWGGSSYSPVDYRGR